MPGLEYHTVDGLTIRLTYERMVEHILTNHPEIRVTDIEETLTRSTRICAHTHIPNRRIYEGHPVPRGLHHTEMPIVAVQLDSEQTGWVVTAYRSARQYQGVQLSPI